MNTKTNISDIAIKPIKVRSQPPVKRSSSSPRRLSRQGPTTSNVGNEVYYGDSSVSVPFRWESRPGTPKVNFGERRPLPPLTPPPSYLSSPARKSVTKHHSETREIYSYSSSSNGILHKVLLPKLNLMKKGHYMNSSPSLSSSSSTSSSSVSSSPWSSSRSARSSPCTPDSEGQPRRKLAYHLRRKEDENDEDDDEYEETHLPSLCFGIAGRSNSSKRGCSSNFIKLLLKQHA